MSVKLTINKEMESSLKKMIEEEDKCYDEKLAGICSAWKERSQAIFWISWLNKQFELSTETFACAVQTFDRFLGVCKVQSKYLRCAALASYHIAAKLLEEEKCLPTMTVLIQTGSCSFNQKDLSRMENIILTKLNWQVKTPTSYDFLEILFGIFRQEQEEPLTEKDVQTMPVFKELCSLLQKCICSSRFSKYKNSTLAFSIISVVSARHYPNWYKCLAPLQAKIKTPIKEFLHCRELVKSCSMIRKYSKSKRNLSVVTTALSPIQENPFELEYSMFWENEAIKENDVSQRSSGDSVGGNGVGSRQVDSASPRFHSDIDDALPAAKRPRFGACRLQSSGYDDSCQALTSPIKSIRI